MRSMNILYLDTSQNVLTVGVLAGGRNFPRTADAGKNGHTRILMGEIDAALNEASVDVGELDAVAAVTGPGSFTGIRIGAATAAAICRGTGAKKIAVTEFELIAYDRGTVNAAVEAGRGNLYCAHCRNGAAEETYFLSAEERADAEREGGFVYDTVRDRAQVFAEIALKKAESGEYAAAFEPFYMRKSQAERAQDEV